MVFRRRALPPTIKAQIAADTPETILGFSSLTDQSWLVALRYTVAHVHEAGVSWQRPWCDVHRASFDPDHYTLSLWWVREPSPWTGSLDQRQHATLARLIRERVEWSVIMTDTVSLESGQSVNIAIRRDHQDHLFSQVIPDDGVDLTDPRTANMVNTTLTRMQKAAGLP